MLEFANVDNFNRHLHKAGRTGKEKSGWCHLIHRVMVIVGEEKDVAMLMEKMKMSKQRGKYVQSLRILS